MGLLVALSENTVQGLISKGCKYSKNANFYKAFLNLSVKDGLSCETL